MSSKEEIKKELLDMKNMTEHYFNMHQDGGAMVVLVNYDCYVLFEVPLYGGHPILDRVYHKSELDELINTALGWI